jgi:hypothetical protein
MCIDYTDLNKHCPKDPFGFPRIDEVVDSTTSCELLSFLDCYSGYHQISLREEDQIKTSFITPFGAYYYMTMSFGLKNTGELINGPSSSVSRTRLEISSLRHMLMT